MESNPYLNRQHRLVKLMLDDGSAESAEQAEERFRQYRLALHIDPKDAGNPQHQATLLTAVALGRRAFLGGVKVECPANVRTSVPLPLGRTLGDAVMTLGGKIGPSGPEVPLVFVGGDTREKRPGFRIRTIAEGWRGGIIPAHSGALAEVGSPTPLAAMLSAGLAINEAFLFVHQKCQYAGKRPVGLSLWSPEKEVDWLKRGDEPELTYLPNRLWLIGLGHLGQAYLWGLGLFPYPNPSELSLTLQDFDIITPSTESTSILSDATMAGTKKTRAMATWAEQRGFQTRICERRFTDDCKRQDDEPSIALCGLDSAAGRRSLDQVGFDMVIEAGLGQGPSDFRSMRLHVLPGSRPAEEIWQVDENHKGDYDRPAYHRLIESGTLNRCGTVQLANKAVGAPFVGAVAASLVLSELLIVLHGGRTRELIDLDLLAIEHRSSMLSPSDFLKINPGYTRAVPVTSA